MRDDIKYTPPKWADHFLEWWCSPQFIEEVQGDLHEAFYKRCEEKGLSYARILFLLDVFRSIPHQRNKKRNLSKPMTSMLRNNFPIIWRKLMRRKVFTMINVTGLSVSLAGALLIYLYVMHELSFDRFNEKVERIYRVYCVYANPGEAERAFANTPAVFASTVKQEIPGVEEVVRLFDVGNRVIFQYNDKVFSEPDVFRADAGFFNVFTASFLSGSPGTALSQPRSVVLSRSSAAKLFGTPEEAIDKMVDIDTYGKETYKVTGVVENFPPNSHFQFTALLSIDYANEKYHPDNWLSHDPVTYVLVSDGSEVSSIEDKIVNMTDKILNPIYSSRLGRSYSEHKQLGGRQEYRLQPLERVHLYSADMGEKGSIVYVYLFTMIGVMLICTAAFNYINLSTARSSWEAKGVGVRKALGATRTQLRNLFLMESVCVAVVASPAAIVLAQMVLVWDNSIIHDFVPFHQISINSCVLLLALAIVVGLLSGLAPARIISSFNPTKVLKGQLTLRNGKNNLRQILVVSQFVGSMGLIMGTLLISQQLRYMQSKGLGFDKENLMIVRNVDKLGERKNALRQAIVNETSVVSASLCYNDVGDPYNYAAFTPVELIDQGRKDIVIGIPVYIGDRDYLNTLGVKLIYGHPFPQDLKKENQQIMLNQEALRAVGWQDRSEDDLIGKMIDVNGLRYELAGVVEDYNFLSLRQKIGPAAIMSHYYQGYESLMLRIKPGGDKQTILRVQEHWKQLAPEVPFEYSFVDEDLEHLYTSEERMAVLFTSFASLAIFIACLGLLGLAMFLAEQRVKEIGVRKVLGASVSSIVLLLTQNIAKLILLAFLIATPLVWYLVGIWLDGFAYKIEVGAFTFLLAGGVTMAIAIATIGVQSFKASIANPVDSLKYE